jgi:hypothetical protein
MKVFNSDHYFKNVRDELTNTIYTWITNEDWNAITNKSTPIAKFSS